MKRETTKSNVKKWVVFKVGDQKLALPLEAVERIARIVEITPLPESPSSFLGVINVQGQVIPVVHLRRRLRLPDREPDLNDQLILVEAPQGRVALPVDETLGLIEREGAEVIEVEKIFSEMKYTKGLVKSNGEMILILDVTQILSGEESKRWEGVIDVGAGFKPSPTKVA